VRRISTCGMRISLLFFPLLSPKTSKQKSKEHLWEPKVQKTYSIRELDKIINTNELVIESEVNSFEDNIRTVC
jgi:hypothetical protein